MLFITLYFKKILMHSDLISPHFETSERRISKISPKTFEGGYAPSDLPSWFDELFFCVRISTFAAFQVRNANFCLHRKLEGCARSESTKWIYLLREWHSTEVALALLTQLPVVQFWAFLKHFSTKIYWGILLSQWTVSMKQTHLSQSRGP